MRFRYSETDDIGQSPAFSNQPTVLRPYINVQLGKGDMRVSTLAVVDSGADFCLFPSSFAEELKIPIPNVRWCEFRDATGNLRIAYFEEIEISIVNPDTYDAAVSFRADVGFSAELEENGVAYLGNHGFFSRCRIDFHFPEQFFEINF